MNYKRFFKTIFILIPVINLMFGCFPDDEQKPLRPFKGNIGSTAKSVYHYQSYYSLTDSMEVSFNANTAWDLGFEASTDGEHVILNNSDRLRVANLGNVEFSQIDSVPVNAKWFCDASSGNYNLLAINGWVNTQSLPYEYSQNVYILGQLDDLEKVIPFKKFKLVELTNQYYKLEIANLDNSGFESITIEKNPNMNYVKASVRNTTKIVHIEPNSNAWDIQFSAYEDSIPDDNGKMYLYPLKGAFINHTRIKVAKYYITKNEVATNTAAEENDLQDYFENDSIIVPLPDSLYSSDWDAIGWEWKIRTEKSDVGKYVIDSRRIYLIKCLFDSTEYKLRFLGYYNKEGDVGYPMFQFIKM